MSVDDGAKINILSLSGGGYRGLYSARVLDLLEQRAGKPIGQCFDLIAGTSIGGIIGLAVAFEVPMSVVVDAFKSKGKKIFPRRRAMCGLIGSRYKFGPVGELVDKIIPSEAKLADARHALVVPVLNLTLGKGQLMKTRHNAAWDRDVHYSARQVAMATSAAPIYFPIAKFSNQLFSDGGLFANAPDLVALHEANYFLGVKDSDVRMMSIGTAAPEYAMPHSTNVNKGVARWLKPTKFPLIQVILTAQERLALQIAQHRLGGNYLRVDARVPHGSIRDLGLDKVSAASTDTLLAFAQSSFDELIANSDAHEFLGHSPRSWIIDGGD